MNGRFQNISLLCASSQDLARVLEAHWGLGRPVGSAVLKAVQSRGTELLSIVTPYQATIVLQAMVYSEHRPSPVWLDSFLRASAKLLQDRRYTPMQLVKTLRCLSQIRCVPGPEWMDAWLEAMEEALPRTNISLVSQASHDGDRT